MGTFREVVRHRYVQGNAALDVEEKHDVAWDFEWDWGAEENFQATLQGMFAGMGMLKVRFRGTCKQSIRL